MLSLRLATVAALAVLSTAAAPRAARTPTLVVTVTAGGSAATSMRVIASAGVLRAGGETHMTKSDTLRVSTPAELTSTDPVMIASFIGENGQFIRAMVKEDGVESSSARGEMIVIIRTPLGARIEAMHAPDSPR